MIMTNDILVPSIREDAPDIVIKLLTTLLETNNYGERMGAAYGLAGIIKVFSEIGYEHVLATSDPSPSLILI